MAPLMGVSLALMPALAVLGAAAGLAAIVIMRHSALRSSWGISVCFLVMLAISQYYQIERDLVSGVVVLASLVLLRSVFTRRRRLHVATHPVYRDTEEDDDLEEQAEIDADPDADLGHATTSHR